MRSGGMQTHACIPPHIFSGKTAALLLHIRQHRVAPHKISGAKQMQTVIEKQNEVSATNSGVI